MEANRRCLLKEDATVDNRNSTLLGNSGGAVQNVSLSYPEQGVMELGYKNTNSTVFGRRLQLGRH